MATIGHFTASGTGFDGTIKTLRLRVRASVRAVEQPSGNGPDFHVFSGNFEFGSAWKKTSDEGHGYLLLKLDDPLLPAPIYATLIEAEGEEGLSLIWARAPTMSVPAR